MHKQKLPQPAVYSWCHLLTRQSYKQTSSLTTTVHSLYYYSEYTVVVVDIVAGL